MAFVGGDYSWLKDGGAGERDQDARALFFYIATVNTPAMAAKMVGAGSQYALAERHKHGHYLDGAKEYHLKIPADVPAKDFWSVVIHDPQPRSELQTCQRFPSRKNRKDEFVENADGSVTL
jgi:hypothetical protein